MGLQVSPNAGVDGIFCVARGHVRERLAPRDNGVRVVRDVLYEHALHEDDTGRQVSRVAVLLKFRDRPIQRRPVPSRQQVQKATSADTRKAGQRRAGR
jgi:hypothetical protein